MKCDCGGGSGGGGREIPNNHEIRNTKLGFLGI